MKRVRSLRCPSKVIVEPSSSFSPFIYWPWGEQFALPCAPTVMHSLITGPKQWGQSVIDWNPQNCEPKQPLSFYQLITIVAESWVDRVAQEVECLPSKCEASTTHTKKSSQKSDFPNTRYIVYLSWIKKKKLLDFCC
jgi:hypothetical protein